VIGPAAVLAAALAVRIWDPAPVEGIRLQVFDVLLRLAPRPYRDLPVRVVDFDDETLRRLGQWPWPRTMMATLVERLHALGAAPIAFDVVFAEPDRTSPAQVVPLWPSTPELDALRLDAGSLPDHDALLAEAIQQARVVTGFALIDMQLSQGVPPLPKASFAFAGPDPSAQVIELKDAVTSLPIFEQAASGNGHLTIIAERDGITRRLPLLLRIGSQLYPSVVLEALRAAQGASTYVIKSVGGSGELGVGQAGIVSVKVGAHVVPTDAKGVAWVYFSPREAARTIPVWRVLDGQVSPDELRGRMVFVGTSATGLKDIRATPLDPATPGVEVHAQMAEQILTGGFLQRPDWADGAEICYLALFGLLLVVLLARASAMACALVGAGAVLAAGGLSWLAFARARWLLDPAMPSLSAIGIYLVGSFMNFVRTERERGQVRQAFSRYLSPALADLLAKHPERLRLGGETRIMTILFADIRGFTTLAERFNAEHLARFMNRFLTPMTGIIQRQRGAIDKYIGDCIMAFWNAPVDDPDHARDGALAALGMRRHLVEFNQELRAEAARAGQPFRPVFIGIGLNTGECSVGNFGSEQRFDYSVLGDTVNLASRLQGQTKTYGVDIVLGETTASSVADLALLELDYVRVAGKTQPARIYALLGDQALAADAGFQALRSRHQVFLAAYRAQRWDAASALLDECLALDTRLTRLRALCHLYAQRINAFRVMPAVEEWDGVWTALAK
jgi:adenylate cyclase